MRSPQRSDPTSRCAGSAEWNSHVRSHCRKNFVAEKRKDPSLEDQLLLLEHEPVYTIGRTPDRSSLSATRIPTKSGWRIRQRAFAASALFNQPRRAGDVSRAGPIDGLSDYRPAAMRPGFTQIPALAGATAHRSSRPIRHCRAATRIAHRSLGRKSQDRFNRCRRSPLDHHARVRVERVRRSLAFRSYCSVRNQ